MANDGSTLRGTDVGAADRDSAQSPRPGLVAVFSGSKPLWLLLPMPGSQRDADGSERSELILGRENLGGPANDSRISRRHVLVSHTLGRFAATDLGSLNGTVIDGQPSAPQAARPLERSLRIGDTLLIPVPDLNPFEANGLTVRDGIVIGPRLVVLFQRIGRIAAASTSLHITGESGAGKENAARAFHQASAVRSGPFVAVNCATIPEGIAERLLFGAKRGAFSGVVTDSDGYIQAAHNGTLFLDEVAELHATVQAKLLRVLETREVLAVGAVRSQPVNMRICSASHRSLQSEVAAGRLREDLYYRIGRPSERVPSLRERPEEIPWLIHGEIQKSNQGLAPHVSFIEACILRPWPGNVRELLVEVRAALQEAAGAGAGRVKAEHLAAGAGQIIKPQSLAHSTSEEVPDRGPSERTPAASSAASSTRAVPERPTRAQIIATLLEAGCNISEAARRLGLHRTQLRRQMEQQAIDLESVRQLHK